MTGVDAATIATPIIAFAGICSLIIWRFSRLEAKSNFLLVTLKHFDKDICELREEIRNQHICSSKLGLSVSRLNARTVNIGVALKNHIEETRLKRKGKGKNA